MANDEITKGTKIRMIESRRMLAANFPGWGDPNYADFFVQCEIGDSGVITDVESHGSNPWTRYSIRLANGSRQHGLVLGTHFEVA